MKLPIKKKFFDMIKDGSKTSEYRDAHITFICEETGETLRKEVYQSEVINKSDVTKKYQEVLEDKKVIVMRLK